MSNQAYVERVPNGLATENAIDQKEHKLIVRELSDILKAENEVFTPAVSQCYQKIGFAGGMRSRSYIGVTFEGMLMPEDIALVQPTLEAHGYHLTNIISTTYRHDLKLDGICIRFHKDNIHGEDGFP